MYLEHGHFVLSQRTTATSQHKLWGVLDEPSSGLDPITSAELDRLILTLARAFGLTIVIVTHELGSIDAVIDHCIVLDRESRSIIAEGTPRELHGSANPHVHRFFARIPEAV